MDWSKMTKNHQKSKKSSKIDKKSKKVCTAFSIGSIFPRYPPGKVKKGGVFARQNLGPKPQKLPKVIEKKGGLGIFEGFLMKIY